MPLRRFEDELASLQRSQRQKQYTLEAYLLNNERLSTVTQCSDIAVDYETCMC